MTLANKLLKELRSLKFDKHRLRYGLLIIAIGLPLIITCVQISMNVISLIGLGKLNPDGNWSPLERAEGLGVFLLFPFGFGFLITNGLVKRILDKFPITLSQGGKDEK